MTLPDDCESRQFVSAEVDSNSLRWSLRSSVTADIRHLKFPTAVRALRQFPLRSLFCPEPLLETRTTQGINRLAQIEISHNLRAFPHRG